jgi:uncharacterized protein involved in exopolysaccharide biosynthesis
MAEGTRNPFARFGGDPIDRVSAVRELARLCSHRGWTILATLGVTVGASLLWVALQEPAFRATAKLELADESGESGVLGSLALLARPPAAMAEIEALRSRTIVEQAVGRPRSEAGTPPDSGSPPRHLGLTTLVEDEGRSVLPSLFSSSGSPNSSSPRSAFE